MDFLVCLILLSITLLIIFLTWYITLQRLKFNLPPGPRPWPIVGNLYKIKPVNFRCFYEWAQIYGPIISVWFGPRLFVVVSSSELAKEVLKEHDQELANRIRIKSQLNFTRNDNNDEGAITLRKYLGEATLNHITRLILGKKFINSEGKFVGQLGREFMSILLELRNLKRPNMLMVCTKWIMQWIFNDEAIDKNEDRLGNFAKKVMKEDNRCNFVESLLSCKDNYDLSEDTIIGLHWDMVIAGKDTVAIVVEDWNPRVLHKAQYELSNVVGTGRIMTEEDFPSLPYLQAIVKEALRLHPPTPLLLPHRAQAHVKIGGYDVPKDTTVLVNVWALGRDPVVWPNPLEFWPERFLENDIDIKGQDFRMLPFGSGRRVCPGAQLGLNLVTSMLGQLLHHFDWALSNEVKFENINMSEAPGVVTYMASPLRLVPAPS